MRYIRQEIFIGKSSQKKLLNSKVCVVGVGALGTLCAELLVRAGVGSLILIDRDKIELDNLQRQHLFGENDVGKFKSKIAKKILTSINSEVNIEEFNDELDKGKLALLDSDLVLDCVDNLETSYLINDYCRKKKIPLVFGSAIRSEGYVFNVFKGSNLHSIFNGAKTFEKCEGQGVLNTITSLIASVQVSEAIKILTGKKFEKDLLRFDLTNNDFISIKVQSFL